MRIIDTNKIQTRLWRNNLSWLIEHGENSDKPHDYYAVFFKSAENARYKLHALALDKNGEIDHIIVSPLSLGEPISLQIASLPDMEAEIIHYKKDLHIHYAGIMTFVLDRRFKIITLKTGITRQKGKLASGLNAEKETLSRDRVNLLKILVTHYINQRPSRTASGFRQQEIIALLYGTLWYKHIKNEAYSRKLNLLLESLVISGDLKENDAVYFVQGQAITTIVAFEKEEKRIKQQLKMHKNIVRFMFIMTIATLLIILVLLGMAGIVDLATIWHKILEIKPVRFLLKFI
ncbi:hypothetical protein BBY84_08640 [Salmonella enterica]|nr:hypothetical protein [Salmonella enterica]ECI8008348.1 hypothetical protein [Salmonella enterica subsp. enterica]HEC8150759.1 hypothetical protein [Salmonella enterica subsp. enterica serovar Mississippi]EBM7133318.1 hypothetical protein [Salmonella enterica]EJU7420729.1 hypothetical protein [Salmonella enterica]